MNYKKCLLMGLFLIAPAIAMKQTRTIELSCLSEPMVRKHLIEKAKILQLLCPHGECVIYSLGNTPAPVVATLKILEEAQQVSDNRCHFVAFSGNWLTRVGKPLNPFPEPNKDGIDFRDFQLTSQKPTEEQVHKYRAYLKKQGLSPAHIMALAQRNIKTVLVDMIVTGSGLSSFLGLLCAWAEESDISLQEFTKALVLVNISAYQGIDNHYGFQINSLQKSYFTLLAPPVKLIFSQKHLPFSPPKPAVPCEEMHDSDYQLLSILDGPPHHKRFIPHFPFEQWESISPQYYEIPQSEQDLLTQIRQDISLNFQFESSPPVLPIIKNIKEGHEL